ncbi:hypothetical protein SAMN04488074_13645 [Lentzea albidocapillata subsp. violacea]|uniref:Uncharacterized protein n=1 Tax=Lentzea albidocapillata subsp. violacea TaxID=128104 RepID=A0A1G9Z0U2_9PSEU|nr:hypothetical protein [Lentzea albidocapillata]SDN14595.1 hypothetical protein SAMN04488074_13645 [Lentzea albidocapillata subsp. violacea]
MDYPGTHDPNGMARQRLHDVAAVAVDNPGRADALLWDWIGRTPTPEGEIKMRQLAYLAPFLVAEQVRGAGWSAGTGMWMLDRPDEGLPPETTAATQAVVRHLNGEPHVADEILDAYTGSRGVPGLWGVGTAALRLLTAELRDQRADLDSGSK